MNNSRTGNGAVPCAGLFIVVGITGVLDKHLSVRGGEVFGNQAAAASVVCIILGAIMLWKLFLAKEYNTRPSASKWTVITLLLGVLAMLIFDSTGVRKLYLISFLMVPILMTVVAAKIAK